MNRLNATQEIIQNLTDFSNKVKFDNKQGFFDINVRAENFYCGLLNAIYNIQLINPNYRQGQFYALDLLDETNKIGVEVTSTTSIQKIQHFIHKIIENKLFEKYNVFYFLIITEKQKNYKEKIFEEIQGKFKLEIIDNNDLIQIISTLPADRITKINEYIIDYLNIRQPVEEIEKRLDRFIKLIEKNGVSEPEITTFLAVERNQFILKLFFGAIKIFDQIECVWQSQSNRKNLIPDFFVETSNNYADIIDFKLPSTKNMIVGIENREHFSSKINEYISQIENYRDFFEDTINRDWVYSKYDIKVFKPTIYLIIGRRNDFENAEWKRIESRFHNLFIKNYDDLIDIAKNSIELFKNQ